jgi:hypothetical protein
MWYEAMNYRYKRSVDIYNMLYIDGIGTSSENNWSSWEDQVSYSPALKSRKTPKNNTINDGYLIAEMEISIHLNGISFYERQNPFCDMGIRP